MLFVFNALIEYALVNVLSRKIIKRLKAAAEIVAAEPAVEPEPVDSDDANDDSGVKYELKPNSNVNKEDNSVEKSTTLVS
jgi:hypothetical protein